MLNVSLREKGEKGSQVEVLQENAVTRARMPFPGDTGSCPVLRQHQGQDS